LLAVFIYTPHEHMNGDEREWLETSLVKFILPICKESKQAHCE
jgi:hypothetical protein